MQKILLLSYLLAFSLLASNIESPPLTYNLRGSNSWYPYFINDESKAVGILNQLIPQILVLANIPAHPVNLPPLRTNKALQKGELDFDVISPAWFEENELTKHFVLSDAIIPIKENIIFLAREKAHWQQSNAIYGQVVGTIRGYHYHDDHKFKRHDFSSEKALIKALKFGRIDVAICGDLPAVYWARQLSANIEIGPLHSQGFLHIRLLKEHRPLLPAINQAIASLKASGEIDKLVAQYM
jgi:hypothetical protein